MNNTENNFVLHKCKDGSMFLLDTYDFIGNTIIGHDKWEWQIEEFYTKIINSNFSIIDIGANIGYHTVKFSKLGKEVHAFEPAKDNFHQLGCNLLLNHALGKVKLHNLALSNVNEKLGIIGRETFSGENTLWSKHTKTKVINNVGATVLGKIDNNDITAIPLDSLNLSPDLIKIDVEGHELKALQGSLKTIKENLPIILIEIHKNKDKENILSLFRELDYELINLNVDPWYADYVAYHKDSEIKQIIKSAI